MEVVETLRGIMDGFDPFYDPTAADETEEAMRKALAAIVRTKGEEARRHDAVTARLIDAVVPKMRDGGTVSASEMTDLLLGVLETQSAEVEKVMRRKILKERLERLVIEAADRVKLRPAKKAEEWANHELVFVRSFDQWDVTLGYFPQHIRHRVIYGQTGTSPLINKCLAVSVRHHRMERFMSPRDEVADRPGLIDFLKSTELDRLAKAHGIQYELPPLGNSPRSSVHTAEGGYEVMVETLEHELRNSPYSAEKLMREISAITIFHEDAGLSFHLVAEFPRGRTDMGQNIMLAFGADLFNLPEQQWEEFKETPPIAIAALEPLKH